MKIELEFEWDHGPDISLTIYGRRTWMFSISLAAYPVLNPQLRWYRDHHEYKA